MVIGQKVHIMEEIQLFPPGQPILKLLLDQTQARQRGIKKLSCGRGGEDAERAMPPYASEGTFMLL